MASEITTYKQSWQVQMVKKLVKNQSDQELESFIFALINYGCNYTGQNKTEEDIAMITKVFANELKIKFNYLTTSQIEIAIKQQDFGEHGITARNLVKCVADYYPAEKQKENRVIEKQLQITPPKTEEKILDRKAKVEFLKKAFNFWKLRGYVADLTGEIWEYAKEISPNYKPTFSEKKRYLFSAKNSCYEYFFNKNKLKYGLVIRVAKDTKLLASKEFKTSLRQQYKEMYLRDFFKKCNWNKNA